MNVRPNGIQARRIESSAEIEALLAAFRDLVSADTAILYKFVDEHDLEVTELIDLIVKSHLLDNRDFHDRIIDQEKLPLRAILTDYENGSLQDIGGILATLKANIRVLRFCDLSESPEQPSRWGFNYANRPPKYLVFCADILKGDYVNAPIPNEGVTGYFCRVRGSEEALRACGLEDPSGGVAPSVDRSLDGPPAKVPYWILSRESIERCRAHRKSIARDAGYCNRESHHVAWLLLPSVSESDPCPIGCIRFEYYHHPLPSAGPGCVGSGRRQCDELYRQKVSPYAVEPVCRLAVAEIHNVLRKQKDHSYAEKFQCLEPILHQLIRIGTELRRLARSQPLARPSAPSVDPRELETLTSVHYLIEHLFYVLKRNTYYGDAIYERTRRFIQDLLVALQLPAEMFIDVWDRLKRHEDLMLSGLDDYRDHFMHQFHVFVLGYILLYGYGLNALRGLMNEKYGRFLEHQAGAAPEFRLTDVIRTWALTALFHDSGYAFERLSEGFEKFSKDTLGERLKAHFFWDDVVLHSETVPAILQGVCDYFVTSDRGRAGFSALDLLRILVGAANRHHDHGVISAVILMQKYRGAPAIHGTRYIEAIVNVASVAIALHNRRVYKDVKIGRNRPIWMCDNPFAFLLTYCDTAQEWGRARNVREEERYAAPILESLVIPRVRVFGARDHAPEENFIVELYYPAEASGRAPNATQIKTSLEQVTAAFASGRGRRYTIRYNIRDSVPLGFERTFPVDRV